MRPKFGFTNYINSYPLIAGFLHQKVKIEADLIEDVPTNLNQYLREGKLNFSFVSTAEYMQHQDRYTLVPNFGIGAKAEVKSVMLYHRGNLETLIGMTSQSATSVALLKYLCKEVWKINATFEVMQPNKEYEAFLLIGNDALLFQDPAYEAIDLAKAWKEHTNLPMIFAVLACKNSDFPFEAQLKESLKWSLEHKNQLVDEIHHKFALSKTIISSYFNCLTYLFGNKENEALHLFMQLGKPYVH